MWRLCIPESLEIAIIDIAHCNIGHFGATKTYLYLKSFVHFPCMEDKVQKFVRQCLLCQRCKTNVQSSYVPMKSVVAKDLLSVVSVDLHGPLPVSKRNFSFIFVLLDVHAKFVKLCPLRNATGILVTRKFLQDYINDLGSRAKPIYHKPVFNRQTHR